MNANRSKAKSGCATVPRGRSALPPKPTRPASERPQGVGLSSGRVMSRALRNGILVCATVLGFLGAAWAQDRPAAGQAAKDSTASEAAEPAALNEAEASLSRRYRQFERTLLQMAEYLRKTEPERADLLIRAIGKSKEDRVGLQMDQIMELLKSDQFGDAIGRQEHLVSNLKGLLELLAERGSPAPARRGEKVARIGAPGDRKTLRSRERAAESDRGAEQARPAVRAPGENRPRYQVAAGKDRQAGRGPERLEQEKPSLTNRTNRPTVRFQDADKRNHGRETRNQGKAAIRRSNQGVKQAPKEQIRRSRSKKKSKKSEGGAKNPSKRSGSQGKGDGSPEASPSDQSESDSSPQQAEKKTPGREEIEQARRAMRQAEEELKRLRGEQGAGTAGRGDPQARRGQGAA